MAKKKKLETITQEELDALPSERQGTWMFTYSPETKKQAKALRTMFREVGASMLNAGPVRLDPADDALAYAFIARYKDYVQTDGQPSLQSKARAWPTALESRWK